MKKSKKKIVVVCEKEVLLFIGNTVLLLITLYFLASLMPFFSVPRAEPVGPSEVARLNRLLRFFNILSIIGIFLGQIRIEQIINIRNINQVIISNPASSSSFISFIAPQMYITNQPK